MSEDAEPLNEQREAGRWSSLASKDALKTHLTLAVGLALCALAFWFELGRAMRGNHLSWVYVFEWPLLAGFAIYMWWKILHPVTIKHDEMAAKEELAPEYQGMLAAWQEEQRKLEELRMTEEQASGSLDHAQIQRSNNPGGDIP